LETLPILKIVLPSGTSGFVLFISPNPFENITWFLYTILAAIPGTAVLSTASAKYCSNFLDGRFTELLVCLLVKPYKYEYYMSKEGNTFTTEM